MRKKVFYLLFFIQFCCFQGFSQESRKLTFENLKLEIIEYLFKTDKIDSIHFTNYKNSKYTFNILGLQNGTKEGELINGIYVFSADKYGYFVIVENNLYTILDVSSRHNLDVALLQLINFCDRNKYCVEITNDYVAKLLRTYYNENKNLNRALDINCERGINNTDDLP
jgi:hypothetical protein